MRVRRGMRVRRLCTLHSLHTRTLHARCSVQAGMLAMLEHSCARSASACALLMPGGLGVGLGAAVRVGDGVGARVAVGVAVGAAVVAAAGVGGGVAGDTSASGGGRDGTLMPERL